MSSPLRSSPLQSKPLVFVIVGILAAGKTELLKCLKDQFTRRGRKVAFVPEPVNRWKGEDGILKRFYADPKRYGYHFQTKAFHDRVRVCQDAYNLYGDSVDAYILERSVFCDRLFVEMLHDDGMLDDMELQHYFEWWSLWAEVMPFTPDVFLWLDPDLDVCMRRLAERNRPGEEAVSRDYQKRLWKKHLAFFGSGEVTLGTGKVVKVVRLPWNDNYRDHEDAKERVTKYVQEVMVSVSGE